MTPNDRIDLYKRVFIHNPDGARILEDLSSLFYDCEVFVPGQDGVTQTAFNAGRRKVVGYIIAILASQQTMESIND